MNYLTDSPLSLTSYLTVAEVGGWSIRGRKSSTANKWAAVRCVQIYVFALWHPITNQPALCFAHLASSAHSNPISSGDGQSNGNTLIYVAHVLTLHRDGVSDPLLPRSTWVQSDRRGWREREEETSAGSESIKLLWKQQATQADREVTAARTVSDVFILDCSVSFRSVFIQRAILLVYRILNYVYPPPNIFAFITRTLIQFCWTFPTVLFHHVWVGFVGCSNIHESATEDHPGHRLRNVHD